MTLVKHFNISPLSQNSDLQDEIPEADVVSDDGGSGDGGDVCEVISPFTFFPLLDVCENIEIKTVLLFLTVCNLKNNNFCYFVD